MKSRVIKKLIDNQNQVLTNFGKNVNSKFEKLNTSLNEIKSLVINQNTNTNSTKHMKGNSSDEPLYFFIPRNDKTDLKRGNPIRFYYLNNGQVELSPKVSPLNLKMCKKYLEPFTMCSKLQSLIAKSNYNNAVYGNFKKIKDLLMHKNVRKFFAGKYIILNCKNNNVYSILPKEHKLNVYAKISPAQKVVNPKFHVNNKSSIEELIKSNPRFQSKGLMLYSINNFIKKAGLKPDLIFKTNINTNLKPSNTYSFRPALSKKYQNILFTNINNIKLLRNSGHDACDKELKSLDEIKAFAPSIKFYKVLKRLIYNSNTDKIDTYLKVWIEYYHVNHSQLAKFHVKYLFKQLMFGIVNHKLWNIKYILHRLSFYVPMNNKFTWGSLIQELGMNNNQTQKIELIIDKMLGIINDSGYSYSKEAQIAKNKCLKKTEREIPYVVFTKSSYQNYMNDKTNLLNIVTLNDNHLMTYHNVSEKDLAYNNKLTVSFYEARKVKSISSKAKLAIKPMQFRFVFPRLDCVNNTNASSSNVSISSSTNSTNINKAKISKLCKKALNDISNSYKFAINNKSKTGASLSPKLGSKLFKSKLVNDVDALKPSLSNVGTYDNLMAEISDEPNMKKLYSSVVAYINKLLDDYHINNKNVFSINSSDISNSKGEITHRHDLKISNNSSKLNDLVKQIDNKLNGKSDMDEINLIKDVEELQSYLPDNQFSQIWNDFSNSELSSDELNNLIKN